LRRKARLRSRSVSQSLATEGRPNKAIRENTSGETSIERSRPLAGETGSDEVSQSIYEKLAIDLIDECPNQPRHAVDAVSLEELTQSVHDHGLLQPIRVRTRGDRFEVVAGHRRLMAARRAGLRALPAIVVEIDDDRALIEALIENIQREDLNPVDRGEALRRLRVNLGSQSWGQIGRAIGISRRHVYHLLNLSQLPDSIREDIQVGNVSEKHGRALVRLRNFPDLQTELWQRISKDKLSGDDALETAKELIADYRAGDSPPEERESRFLAASALDHAVADLLRMLPHATMRDIRPLRDQLEKLARQLAELLIDAFHPGDRGRQGVTQSLVAKTELPHS